MTFVTLSKRVSPHFMLVLTTTTTLVQSRNAGDALVKMGFYPNYCSKSMRKRGFKLEKAVLHAVWFIKDGS